MERKTSLASPIAVFRWLSVLGMKPTPRWAARHPLPLNLVAQTDVCATTVGLPSFKALRTAKPYCKIK
jgi:hypothetical protein